MTKTEKKVKEKKNYARKSEKNYTIFRAIFQKFVTKVLYGITYHIVYRLEVHGIENIPKGNNYIAAGNHLSTLDPPLVSAVLPNPIAYMAKKELFEHPVLKVLLDWLGAFAVNRDKLEVSTIRTALSIAKTKNWVLGVFPQGTREEPGEIHNLSKGFVGLAIATKCNILPIGIIGTDKHRKIPFTGKIIVNIGPVIPLSNNKDEMAAKWVDSIEKLTGFKYVGKKEEKKTVNI